MVKDDSQKRKTVIKYVLPVPNSEGGEQLTGNNVVDFCAARQQKEDKKRRRTVIDSIRPSKGKHQ